VRARIRDAWPWAASIAAAALFLAPVLWMALGSLREEGTVFSGSWLTAHGWTLANYAEAWRRAGLARALLNSTLQASAIALCGLAVNATAAYAFARLEFPGRDLLFACVVVLIILPVEVVAVPLLLVVRTLGLTGAWGAAMAGLTLPFAAKAFNIYFLRQHFLSLPSELEEAAVIDGAGAWRQFWSVALPSARPALATVVLLDALTHWGDFLWPLLVSTRAGTRTVQIGLASLFTQPPIHWAAILACAAIATAPIVALFRLLQRHVVAADARAGIK
jgi:multiple sugar transport system permease protein/fructooligosaccharide transport system permease protein